MSASPEPRSERNRVADVASLLAQGALAVFLFRCSGLDLSLGAIAYAAASLVVSMLAAICLHEVGHLCAGELVSWHWRVFKVGPLLLTRHAGKLRLSFATDPRYRGMGLVVNEPSSERASVPSRQIVMLLGGPIMSLVLAVFGWTLWSALEGARYSGLAAGVFGTASAVVLVTTLLPFRSSGHLSDGGKIWALLRGRALAEEQLHG